MLPTPARSWHLTSDLFYPIQAYSDSQYLPQSLNLSIWYRLSRPVYIAWIFLVHLFTWLSPTALVLFRPSAPEGILFPCYQLLSSASTIRYPTEFLSLTLLPQVSPKTQLSYTRHTWVAPQDIQEKVQSPCFAIWYTAA
jgi:hypothetical protein